MFLTLIMLINDLESFFEAVSSSDAKFVEKLLKQKLIQFQKYKSWILIDLPHRANTTSCK